MINISFSAWVAFLGGLGIFMFGIHTTSSGLQMFAANRLKELLESLTKKSYLAVLFGIVMTVAFQSSTATTVLVVEFVNVGLMSLGRALGIVLGSALGTSLSIQLIAFKMLNLALGFIFIGFILYLVIKTPHIKPLGQAMIGFGLIFVGISIMSGAFAPLKDIPQVQEFLAHLGVKPFFGILVGLVLTTLMQSSTATVAILISLADQGLINLGAVIPLVLGAHIGGTVTTLISTLTAQKQDARRVALANTLYKVLATLLVLPFLPEVADLLIWLGGDLKRQVANSHLVFSVLMIILFMPLNNQIAKVMVRILPDSSRGIKKIQFRHIDEASLEVPAIALTQVHLEIQGMGKSLRDELMARIPTSVLECRALPSKGSPLEQDFQWYYQHIFRFLAALSAKEVTAQQHEDILNTQFILKEFQYVGDALFDLSTHIGNVTKENRQEAEEIWGDMKELYETVLNNYNRMLGALKSWDRDLAGEVIREHPDIVRLQRALQFGILAKTTQWENLDIVNLLYRIDKHSVNIAQVVMGLV
ncbi:MAG: Na/Pi cotransporter family protein [Desulfitobacterium sp.]